MEIITVVKLVTNNLNSENLKITMPYGLYLYVGGSIYMYVCTWRNHIQPYGSHEPHKKHRYNMISFLLNAKNCTLYLRDCELKIHYSQHKSSKKLLKHVFLLQPTMDEQGPL